ncbi:MAG: hypothetical protein MI799_00020, partial [Desulfobacterales bacterium]|nr:hypothetical protein [Desulfobacterales bacterium]
MKRHLSSNILFYLYGALTLAFLYLPVVAVGFASVSNSRYLRFPIRKYATGWYGKALASDTVMDLLSTSVSIALIVTGVSLIIGFFGALAFARYRWRFRKLYQKLILLPIFFPQTVLGLALLMWFNTLGITPTWKTAI